MLEVILAPSTAPVWGLVGILLTQIANIVIARRKSTGDIAAAHLTQINETSKNLVEALFRQVKEQGERIEVLLTHRDECEDQHRETQRKLFELQKQVSTLERTTTNRGA